MLTQSIAAHCNKQPHTVTADATLIKAIEMMRQHQVSSILVVEGRKPIGIITNRDLPRLLPHLYRIPAVLISEVMTSPLSCISQDLCFHDALEMMIKHNLRHLPVVDDQGLMTGILTETDVTDAISANEMMRMVRVYEIMVERVISIDGDHSLSEALNTMQQQRVGSIVVTENQQLTGLITLKDIPALMLDNISPDTPVSRLVQQPAYTERGDTIAQIALERMKELNVNYLVVTNSLDEIIGLVSRSCFSRNMTRQGLARILRNNQKLQISIDQLEAKLHEMHLREMSDVFSHVVNNSPDAILICQQNKIVMCNERSNLMFGDNLISKDISEILTDKNIDPLIQTDQERVHFSIRRMRRVNGEMFDVESNVLPIVHNNEAALLFTIRDISQRLREERFQAATSQILEQTIQGKKQNEISPSIALMLEERFIACRCSLLFYEGDCLHMASAPSLPESYLKKMRGCLHPDQELLASQSGLLIQIGASNDPLADQHRHCESLFPSMIFERICDASGTVHGLIILYLPEGSQVSDAMRQSLAISARLTGMSIEHQRSNQFVRKLKMAVESSGESMVITDLNGTIEYVNPAFTRQTGYNYDEVMGKNPRMLKSGMQDQAYYEKLWDTITSGNVFHSAIIDRRKDGSFYPSMMTISPVFDENRQITHYVSTQQDLSEYKRIEEQLRQSQKMESLGILVGGIAHNFNNMLAGIAGNLYLAKIPNQNPENLARHLETSENIVFRAKDMIQQLMAFARKGYVQKQDHQLESLIREAVSTAKFGISEDIELDCHYDLMPSTIHGDYSQLQQIVVNLITNARDAVALSEKRRIEVSLEMADSHQLHSQFPELDKDHYACLRVCDSGIGISREQLEHIFEPFYTTKEVGQGTGLGLSMTLGGVQSHGGKVDVRSSIGTGSEFLVYLPVLPHQTEPLSKPTDHPLLKGDIPKNILLVDDEDIVLDSYKSILEQMGASVVIAKDGEQALQLFQQHTNIDLLICDVVMPKMGGVELMQHLRVNQPDLPVVFITGYDAENIRSSQDGLKRVRILEKPFGMESLISQVIELLSDTL